MEVALWMLGILAAEFVGQFERERRRRVLIFLALTGMRPR
jgi:hypothetical protein